MLPSPHPGPHPHPHPITFGSLQHLEWDLPCLGGLSVGNLLVSLIPINLIINRRRGKRIRLLLSRKPGTWKELNKKGCLTLLSSLHVLLYCYLANFSYKLALRAGSCVCKYAAMSMPVVVASVSWWRYSTLLGRGKRKEVSEEREEWVIASQTWRKKSKEQLYT